MHHDAPTFVVLICTPTYSIFHNCERYTTAWVVECLLLQVCHPYCSSDGMVNGCPLLGKYAYDHPYHGCPIPTMLVYRETGRPTSTGGRASTVPQFRQRAELRGRQAAERVERIEAFRKILEEEGLELFGWKYHGNMMETPWDLGLRFRLLFLPAFDLVLFDHYFVFEQGGGPKRCKGLRGSAL